MPGVEEADRCPSCERDFTSLYDYPTIYVAGFERTEIPVDLKIPGRVGDYVATLFVHPDSVLMNPKIPKRVVELFQHPKIVEDPRSEYVDYKGWEWIRLWKWPQIPLEESYFVLTKKNVRNIVDFRVNRFLASLDILLGKEVPARLLQPPKLPKAVPYSLSFIENGASFGEKPSEAGFKAAHLYLQDRESQSLDPGRTITFGTLYYEGRINSLTPPPT